MKVVAVIPAHLASIRFPRKILFPFHGLPMIEHVRRRALLSNLLSEVIVATCDKEIADVVKGYGGKVIMTTDTHTNGTTRVAEAIANIDCTHVLLLQGDEPLILPRHIDAMVNAIAANEDGNAWNATAELEDEIELDKHSFVKCAVSSQSRIMYCFRRSPCFSSFEEQRQFVRKILGIIAYKKSFLLQLVTLEAAQVERVEFIEQMRIIDSGHEISSVPVSPSLPSVNLPEEADIVLKYIESNAEQLVLLNKTINR